ncbi:MAG: hypothetical protein H6624_11125 [Bdellovibrionaceae bacterium]|nr:hypothetical protein [Bdellovibrionales bacterium]MCB9084889.1 hypothetical protein [Pseudobdellovibrionaceae bacterium]
MKQVFLVGIAGLLGWSLAASAESCFVGVYRDTHTKEIVNLELKLEDSFSRSSVLSVSLVWGDVVSVNLACPLTTSQGLCVFEDDGGSFFLTKKGKEGVVINLKGPLVVARENGNIAGLEVDSKKIRNDTLTLSRSKECGTLSKSPKSSAQ